MAWRGSTRARRLPGNWQSIRKVVLDRDGRACQIRRQGCTGIATEVDHIIAGDDHSLANLRAACAHCNARQNEAVRPRRMPEKRPPDMHPGLLS